MAVGWQSPGATRVIGPLVFYNPVGLHGLINIVAFLPKVHRKEDASPLMLCAYNWHNLTTASFCCLKQILSLPLPLDSRREETDLTSFWKSYTAL